MLFSFIIPAYKVELTIEKCLNSIIHQNNFSQDNYEIIVVDDGSPDKSGEIAKSMLKNIKNAKVIHKTNGGLSDARNAGLKVASGEYVWFIDSDDWISPDSLHILSHEIQKYNEKPDVIMFRANKYYCPNNEEPLLNEYPFSNQGIRDAKEIFLTTGWRGCVWIYLIKRSVLQTNNLSFMYGVLHEDNEFTPRLLCKVKTIVQLNNILYFYRIENDNSITKIPNFKRVSDIIKVCNSLDKFCLTEKLNSIEGKRMSSYIALTLNNSFYLANNHFRDRKSEFNELIRQNKHLLRHLKNSGIKKYQLEFLLFSIFNNYLDIYRILQKFK